MAATTSKEASANGSRSARPSISRASIPASAATRRAAVTIAGSASIPVTLAPRDATARSRTPSPQPTFEHLAAGKLAHQLEDQPLFDRLGGGTQRRRAPGGVQLRPDRGGSIRPAHASARAICVTAASISSRVVPRPRLNLTAPMPTSGGTPMAAKTGESVTWPA